MKEQNLFWNRLLRSIPEISNFMTSHDSVKMPDKVRSQLSEVFDFLSGTSGKERQSTFLFRAAQKVLEEWNSTDASDFRSKAQRLIETGLFEKDEILDLFFPEYRYGGSDPEKQIDYLRKRRTVTLKSLNPSPLTDPSRELVFTSNVLLTLPPLKYKERLSRDMKERVSAIEKENQKYWFDHPILMGVDRNSNEMIYGLRGLAESFRFEKEHGIVPSDSRLTVILSLSVTHDGLKSVAQEYLSGELKGVGGLDDLDVFLFTEEDTLKISETLNSVLEDSDDSPLLEKVFGVDGRYGRHYSFLKAIVPLWALTVDSEVKGTFKIDLDQVFPQKELKSETGKTAFEHFMTPLWGASGTDSRGNDVELGMIAGALVNEKDIYESIFTTDVPLLADNTVLKGENRIFFKQYPMGLSTLAEMMATYEKDTPLDGIQTCLSRVHVTGGTNGILCTTLRRKRPFTPTFIGRAEDQAYLLSVLMETDSSLMRYVHEPGLIMRHDKEAFAGDSIEASKLGTWVADLLRILYFSSYAAFLPGAASGVKEELDPFTGCFISTTPMTKIFLRLILKILENPSESELLLELAETQLSSFVLGEESAETVKEEWITERKGWNRYYEALDVIEQGLAAGNNEILEKAERLKKDLLRTRIR